ncbi:MAG: RNA polymerase sigma factor [Planctomycetota bacterium]
MNEPSMPLPADLLEHGTFLRRLAHSLVRDEHAADDLEQDTWLCVLEHPPADRRSIRSWLGTIARNVLLQRRRAEGRRRAREAHVATPERLPSAADTIAREETLRALVNALLALGEPYRSALLMRYFENLPPRRIAARKALSVNTVRSHIQRGLQQLRAQLDEVHGGDRGSWCRALVLVLGCRAPALTMAGATTGGMLAMTVKAKLAAVLLVIAAGVATIEGISYWGTTKAFPPENPDPRPLAWIPISQGELTSIPVPRPGPGRPRLSPLGPM